MSTLTVNIQNKKTNVTPDVSSKDRPFSKAEQELYDSFKRSLDEIRMQQEGEVEFKDVRAMLAELEVELG